MPSRVLCHMAFSSGPLITWQLAFSKLARERDSLVRWSLIYCNHRSDMPYSVGWKSVTGPTHTEREGLTQGHELQEAVLMRAALKTLSAALLYFFLTHIPSLSAQPSRYTPNTTLPISSTFNPISLVCHHILSFILLQESLN